MLQIISGKFYGDSPRFNNTTSAILYSNAEIKEENDIWRVKITPCASSSTKLNKYEIDFINQLEKTAGLSFLNIGSETVIYQFKNILTFYLDCIFEENEHDADSLCANRETLVTRTPSNYLRYGYNEIKPISREELKGCDEFVSGMIGLSRYDYLKIIGCINVYCLSIRLLKYDPNLAYSMLVFALETLSKYNEYELTWEDYSKNTNIDKILKGVDDSKAELIRKELVSDAELKLGARFVKFAVENIQENYYTDKAVGFKIQYDDVEEALVNSYKIRSKYAHVLETIMDQSVFSDVSKVSDYFIRKHSPFFTYSGLMRLTRHIIINFVRVREKFSSEQINWINNLPGAFEASLGPSFWLSKIESRECKQAKIRYETFVNSLWDYEICDMKDVVKLYINQYRSVKEEYRRPIFALCLLWEDLINEDEIHECKVRCFVDKNCSMFNKCCVENVVAYLLGGGSITLNDEELEGVLTEYLRDRTKANGYRFRFEIETMLYLFAADIFSDKEEKSKYWFNRAKLNAANKDEILDIVISESTIRRKIEMIRETREKNRNLSC